MNEAADYASAGRIADEAHRGFLDGVARPMAVEERAEPKFEEAARNKALADYTLREKYREDHQRAAAWRSFHLMVQRKARIDIEVGFTRETAFRRGKRLNQMIWFKNKYPGGQMPGVIPQDYLQPEVQKVILNDRIKSFN